jgi:hypothetical protein
MAKNIVFVLHGIGQYTDGWINLESSAVPVLKESAKQYSFFDGKSLDTFVEFVPVLYDDVFERIMKHWADLGKGLRDAVPVLPKFGDKVLGYLEGADDDKWSLKTGADVALYWGFRLFQQRVVLRVLAQISAKIADTIAASDHVPEYHVLAHSMGTAVAHDALHHLGTESWLTQLKSATFDDEDGKEAAAERDKYLASLEKLKELQATGNPFNPTLFSFESITMLSNVSGLIHPSESPYHSIVRPGSARDDNAYTRNYLNANHRFDPITIVGDFRMPDGWKMRGGMDLTCDHLIGDPEGIHDAAHYVRHPNLHLRLLSLYVDPYMPTDADIAQIALFQSRSGFNAIKKKAVLDLLERIAKGDAGPLVDVIGRVKELSRIVGV